MITDQDAQRIASEWHGGQSSALYSFASTGTIRPDLRIEIMECLSDDALTFSDEGLTFGDANDLDNLLTYINATHERGPVSDWYERVIRAEETAR